MPLSLLQARLTTVWEGKINCKLIWVGLSLNSTRNVKCQGATLVSLLYHLWARSTAVHSRRIGKDRRIEFCWFPNFLTLLKRKCTSYTKFYKCFFCLELMRIVENVSTYWKRKSSWDTNKCLLYPKDMDYIVRKFYF